MYIGLSISSLHLKNSLDKYGYATLDSFIKLSEIIWVDPTDVRAEAILFSEDELLKKLPSNIYIPKILLLTEPFETSPITFKLLKKRYHYFDLILTFDEQVLNKFGNAQRYLVGGTFLTPSERIELSTEKKGISIVASEKRVTVGHKLRHEIISAAKEWSTDIEVFGRSYNAFESRQTPFKNFSYSIVIENVRERGFFTEKLIDPLLFKTVPIYWGAPDIANYFDKNGLLIFTTIHELKEILEKIECDSIFVSEKTILSNQAIALSLMSKELNIQNAITKFMTKKVKEVSIGDLVSSSEKYLNGELNLEENLNELSKLSIAQSIYEGKNEREIHFVDKIVSRLKKW